MMMCGSNFFFDMVEGFVRLKRTEGYKYEDKVKDLRRLGSVLEELDMQDVRFYMKIVDRWCCPQPYEKRSTYSYRVSLIRQFGLYIANRGYQVELPESVRNARNKLFVPYIFSHDEMNRIFREIDNLPENSVYNSKNVYPVLFRMLYGCGLRVGEALALRIRDVDLENGILSIQHAKYDKSRLVPMSESLANICRKYYDDNLCGFPPDDFFFRNKRGGCRGGGTVGTRFKTTLCRCGIPYYGKEKGPRLHDLRHTFCCHSLKQMSDNGVDLYCALPILSAYVGHSTINATERYLRLTRDIYPEIEKQMGLFSGSIYPEVPHDE